MVFVIISFVEFSVDGIPAAPMPPRTKQKTINKDDIFFIISTHTNNKIIVYKIFV